MKIRVLIRGGGDLASGIAHRLFRSGLKVIITELPQPLVIRRTIAFASSIYEDECNIEGVRGKLCNELQDSQDNYIPVFIDPECNILKKYSPHVLVDGIMAKYNTGTYKNMASLVIALGPGFNAGVDVHKVIETQRGHYLGRIIDEGFAQADTGVPGEIDGISDKRIIRAPVDGIFISHKEIGDFVSEGDPIGSVNGIEIKASLSGVIRGLIKSGLFVRKRLKIGDIDHRGKKEFIYSISDKARALGGSVLEVILSEFSSKIFI